jgi:hypothetical protein
LAFLIKPLSAVVAGRVVTIRDETPFVDRIIRIVACDRQGIEELQYSRRAVR